MYEENKAKGLEVVLVSFREDPDLVKRTVRERGYSARALLDKSALAPIGQASEPLGHFERWITGECRTSRSPGERRSLGPSTAFREVLSGATEGLGP